MVKSRYSLIKDIKEYAVTNKIPIMKSEGIDFLTTFIIKHQITTVLEIGTAIGYSAIMMALCNPNLKVTTIERDEERIAKAKENIRSVGVENQIRIYEGDAVEILPTLEQKYDMVFIDAAKGKYPLFFQEACRMLKKDGIIFADNVLYKGYVRSDYNKHKQRTAVRNLREFLAEIENKEIYQSEVLEVGDGLAIIQLRRN